MKTQTIFENLKEKYGNHSEAAKALGVSARLYRIWRTSDRFPEPARRLALFLLGAKSENFTSPINEKNTVTPKPCAKSEKRTEEA